MTVWFTFPVEPSGPRWLRCAVIVCAAVALVLLLAAAAGIWLAADWMVRPDRRALEDRHRELLEHPAEFGLTLEKFATRTAEGFSLEGYLATRAETMGKAERTRRMLARLERAGLTPSSGIRGTVVLLHGRSGLKENMLTIAQRFVAADFRCVVYDARAHGESGGKFTTFGEKEQDDLSRVIDQVGAMLGERGESLGPLAAFGLSQGASVLLQAMPEEKGIDCAIAVAPFADLGEQVQNTARNQVWAGLPAWVPSFVAWTGGVRASFDPGDICPLRDCPRVNRPVFLAHGTRDGVIPIEHSRRLHEALPHPANVWREVPDGYHRNVLAEGGDDLYQEMVEFLLAHTAQRVALAP